MKYTFWLLPFVLLKRLLRYMLLRIVWPVKTLIIKKIWRIQCGRNVRFAGSVIVRAYDKHAISIGDNTRFISIATDNVVGLTNPTILCAAAGGKISIGHDSGFSSVVINARERVVIGNYVNIGGNVRIFDNDFHSLDWQDRRPPEKCDNIKRNPVIIDDDVFIGANAIILKGSHIGARSLVSAGSVVFGLNVPPDSLVKGNPAKIYSK